MADRPELTRAVLEAMAAAGCSPRDPGVIAFDGRLHRFVIEGYRKSRKEGWFVLFNGAIPAGCFGSWRTRRTQTWRAEGEGELTPEQRRLERERIAAAKAQRQAERRRLRAQARERAAGLWAEARSTVDAAHPYLVKKRVPAIGLRQLGGRLIVPVRDGDGALRSLEFIGPAGEKRFLKDGEVEGGRHVLGDLGGARALVLCEGYATGASLHRACGLPVAVCFSCGNLLPVARDLRRRHPDLALVVAADDDRHTPGNPGRREAIDVARWVNGAVILPDFDGLDTSTRPTDFNDVHLLGGLSHLRRQLAEKLAAALPAEAGRTDPPGRPTDPGQRAGARALPAPYRWALAALSDPEAETEDERLGRFARRIDAALPLTSAPRVADRPPAGTDPRAAGAPLQPCRFSC